MYHFHDFFQFISIHCIEDLNVQHNVLADNNYIPQLSQVLMSCGRGPGLLQGLITNLFGGRGLGGFVPFGHGVTTVFRGVL